MSDLIVGFISHNRKAQVVPNPEYPAGIDVDAGFQQMCAADLPYPAECCGIFKVTCRKCRATIAYTAAGRPDDPRRVTVPCQVQGNKQIRPVLRLAHGSDK